MVGRTFKLAECQSHLHFLNRPPPPLHSTLYPIELAQQESFYSSRYNVILPYRLSRPITSCRCLAADKNKISPKFTFNDMT